MTLVAANLTEVAEELDSFAKNQETPRVRASFAARREEPPRIGFIMSGQGPQWWGMGRELMRHEPIFRQTMEQCDAALRPWTTFSLLEELGRAEEASRTATEVECRSR